MYVGGDVTNHFEILIMLLESISSFAVIVIYEYMAICTGR